MLRYVQHRLLVSIPTIVLISIIAFLMLYLIPGDPASIYIGENQATPERMAEIRHVMGLDRPLYVQYWDFAWNALQSDLGTSLTMVIAFIVSITLGLIIVADPGRLEHEQDCQQ